MSEIKIHEYQKALIKKLTFGRTLNFNQLLIEEIGSEHMNYHLKKLVDVSFVKKENNKYLLTDLGKDYANSMDDTMSIIEKPPKTSIIINAVRKNKKGEVEFLLNRRMREPYFGKVGRIGGKVQFGEKIEEAAARELMEETGLKAKTFVLEEIYHKIRTRKSGEVVQDVVFYIFFTNSVFGKLKDKIEQQENFWTTKKQAESNPDIDPYDDLVLEERLKPGKFKYSEHRAIAEGY
jgi:8-oxo-dGTP pyrophosphatase MutT (NUDIX family)